MDPLGGLVKHKLSHYRKFFFGLRLTAGFQWPPNPIDLSGGEFKLFFGRVFTCAANRHFRALLQEKRVGL